MKKIDSLLLKSHAIETKWLDGNSIPTKELNKVLSLTNQALKEFFRLKNKPLTSDKHVV